MALPEPLERNGFRVTTKVFTSPRNAASLNPLTKRQITICNLFVNHRLPIADIVRVLDEGYKHVVTVLIEQGLVYDDAEGPEELLSQSQRIRCLENVRRDDEVSERGWTSPIYGRWVCVTHRQKDVHATQDRMRCWSSEDSRTERIGLSRLKTHRPQSA